MSTVLRGGVFPAGTSVSVYPASSRPLDGQPAGTAVATATVDSSLAVTFSLAPGAYVAHAVVGGADRYSRFLVEDAAVAAAPKVAGVLFSGHSVIEGGPGDTTGAMVANRMTTKYCSLLGASENNIGKGSAGLQIDNSTNSTSGVPTVPWSTSGGWTGIFKALKWSTMAKTSTPLLSPLQVAVLMHAYGDMAITGAENFAAKFKPLLRATLNVLRCGAAYAYDDATIAYSGGTGSTIAATNFSRSGSVHQFATAGGTATITVPSWYPGGLPIDVGGIWVVGGKNFEVEVTINGTRKAAYDLDVAALIDGPAGNNPEWQPWQIRIPASELAAGENTIVLTFVASGTWQAAWFDYWQIESQEPPVIQLAEMYYPETYSDFWLTATPMNAAAVDACNAACEEVAAEYADGRVRFVTGFDAVMSSGGRFQSDGIHPNALGAAELAAVLYDDLMAAGLTPERLARTGVA